jgi:hypothetical protein
MFTKIIQQVPIQPQIVDLSLLPNHETVPMDIDEYVEDIRGGRKYKNNCKFRKSNQKNKVNNRKLKKSKKIKKIKK